ncbi:hypothetical protein C7B82_03240 [Stenomitos frigidus ULC18]|uniref:Uncharacterized protein n=2 Tax=Stenomitos TaxID=1844270 RepID=A0A2T1EN02_9CYAN|nr:hypothetical protein C7B82_03240 [Stenomitos frigidus ULC18]
MKVSLLLPPALLKAAKLKATQDEKTLEDWLLSLIRENVQDDQPVALTALDWGRIDSRIDQRIVFLERQVEALADKVTFLLREQPSLQTSKRKNLENDSTFDRALTPLAKTN